MTYKQIALQLGMALETLLLEPLSSKLSSHANERHKAKARHDAHLALVALQHALQQETSDV